MELGYPIGTVGNGSFACENPEPSDAESGKPGMALNYSSFRIDKPGTDKQDTPEIRK